MNVFRKLFVEPHQNLKKGIERNAELKTKLGRIQSVVDVLESEKHNNRFIVNEDIASDLKKIQELLSKTPPTKELNDECMCILQQMELRELKKIKDERERYMGIIG